MSKASSTRVPLIAGNWKLHNTLADTHTLCDTLLGRVANDATLNVDVMVAPPFTALHTARDVLKGSRVALGAQDCFYEDKGAFTGEISAPLLKDLNCSHCLVGHSERRQWFYDDDKTIRRKFWALRQHGLIPVLCVGETLEQRQKNQAKQVVLSQLDAVFKDAVQLNGDDFVVAYEPVWAIGTGQTATPADAQAMHLAIRVHLGHVLGETETLRVRVLYGGSVKPDNAYALAMEPDIDGALVGGASLNAEDFLAIIQATQQAQRP